MKRLVRTVMAAFFSASMFTGAAHAQSITVDLSKLPSETASQLLRAQKTINEEKEKVAVPTISQAKEWANVGKDLAEAVGATAKALSIEVNDFVKTPVGWWAFVFLFWYFLGAKLWAIGGGILVWIILGCVIWRSFRIFHIPQRQLVSEEGKAKHYEYIKYGFVSAEARVWSAIVHVVLFVLLSIVMLVIIF
ncbi:MAG: hypothetical protein Q7S95_01020 [bacterium]|nr:hypothetical protein [bacterium]